MGLATFPIFCIAPCHVFYFTPALLRTLAKPGLFYFRSYLQENMFIAPTSLQHCMYGVFAP